MAGPHRRTALIARHLLPSRAEPVTPACPLAATAGAAAPDLLSQRGGVDDFTRLGFVHLPGVFTQAEVGTIRREIDAMVAREEMQQEIAAGLNENTLSKVIERSPVRARQRLQVQLWPGALAHVHVSKRRPTLSVG